MAGAVDRPDDMQDIVMRVVRALVDFSDQVEVAASEEEHSATLTVRDCREDLGKVIGKQGRIARSSEPFWGPSA